MCMPPGTYHGVSWRAVFAHVKKTGHAVAKTEAAQAFQRKATDILLAAREASAAKGKGKGKKGRRKKKRGKRRGGGSSDDEW